MTVIILYLHSHASSGLALLYPIESVESDNPREACMNVAGIIEFTTTELTPERVPGEMPVQAAILDPSALRMPAASSGSLTVRHCPRVRQGPFRSGRRRLPARHQAQRQTHWKPEGRRLQGNSRVPHTRPPVDLMRTTITSEGGRLIADVAISAVPAQLTSGERAEYIY